MIAFRDNRSLPRSHMIEKLNNEFKKVMLDKWKAEVVYNQSTLFGLVGEFDKIGFYDTELWNMIIDTAINKKKINNTHNFQILHRTLTKMNKNEELPDFHNKIQDKIDELVKKHVTTDR